MFRDNKLFFTVAVAFLTTPLTINAQEVKALHGSDFSIEEIVVTARHRKESLKTVPIAIDAIGSATIQEKAISNIEDIAKYTPGLNFEVGILPNDTRPVIRGLSLHRGRPNVGILIDGIDISSETLTVAGGGTTVKLNLMDLERIEIVKGPQSALYGRSAFSGAINYVTKRPDTESATQSNIALEGDEHSYMQIKAGSSFPIITDQLAASFNIVGSDFEGYYNNPNTGGNLGGIETRGMAFALNFTPNESFSSYFRSEYSEEDYTPRAVVAKQSLSHISDPTDINLSGSITKNSQLLPIPGGAFGRPESTLKQCSTAKPFSHLTGGQYACASMLVGNIGNATESMIDQSANPETGKDFDGTTIKNTRMSLELEWTYGELNVLSLTGYNENKTSIQEDFDLTDFDLQSAGVGSANFNPLYLFADPFGNPPDITPLNNNPTAAITQFGANTNTDTHFDSQQISQEFRISANKNNMHWLLSTLYWAEDMEAEMNQMWWLRESADVDYWNSTFSRFVDPTCTTPGNIKSCRNFTGIQTKMTPNPIQMYRDTQHMSIAASLTVDITTESRVTLEARYLDEEIKYKSLPIDTFINGFLNIPYFDPETFSTDLKFQKQTIKSDAFVPRLSLDWQMTDSTFTYVSIAKGFKPGGIATTDGNGDIKTGHYNPEELIAYEMGLKKSALENRLQLEGAIFLNDYTNQQVPFFVRDPLGITKVSITNAGESELFGFEISAIYRPSENWIITGAYTRAETEYNDYNISDVGNPSSYDKVLSGNVYGDFSGKSFTNSAKHSGTISIRYQNALNINSHYFSDLSGRYESKRYLDQGNLSYLPEYWLLDFSIGVNNKQWSTVFYIDNLLDDDKIKSGMGNVSYGFMSAGQTPPYSANLALPQPRTIGLRLSHKF